MKTAIEQLISEFEELKKTKLYSTSFKGLDDCINLAYAKLELEKQQIIDAREDGYNSTYNSCESGCGGNLILESTNEKYYEQTFKK
jgi:hypothetical protein